MDYLITSSSRCVRYLIPFGLGIISLHFFDRAEVEIAYLHRRVCTIPVLVFSGLFWSSAIANFVTLCISIHTKAEFYLI